MSFIDLDFSDDELTNLFTGPPEPNVKVENTEELVGLTRKLAAQYVDVLAAFARDSFRGESIDAHGVRGAIDALARLAESTQDTDLHRVLQQLAKLVDATADANNTNTRVRDLLRVQMRHWVLRFADCLEGSQRKRMRELVLFDKSNVPLFDQLARIRGIGPRRIQRLYCAGLFTVDTVIRSTPEDIASVTGIPLTLSKRIHEETVGFAQDMKEEAVNSFVDAVDQLKKVLPRFTSQEAHLVHMVRQAMQDLQMNLETSPWGGSL